VKCTWKRGWALSQRCTPGLLWGGMVVDDQVKVEIGQNLLIEEIEKAQQLLVPMAACKCR
jgi:hypothetical protein